MSVTLKSRQEAVGKVLASEWFTEVGKDPVAVIAVKSFLAAFSMKAQFQQGALYMANFLSSELGLDPVAVAQEVTSKLVEIGGLETV